ncbi:MAG: hypothetical protein R3Y60_02005 [bacterium]
MKHKVSEIEKEQIREMYLYFKGIRSNNIINMNEVIKSSGLIAPTTFRCWLCEFEKDEDLNTRRKTHISYVKLKDLKKHLKSILLDMLYEE